MFCGLGESLESNEVEFDESSKQSEQGFPDILKSARVLAFQLTSISTPSVPDAVMVAAIW